jgi:uncharacterized repeat protein (TIGR03803 family)
MSATRLFYMTSVGILLASPLLAKPAAKLITVHSFQGYPADGATPAAKLMYQGGSLYGTTVSGGASGNGTVFKINPGTGAETVVYSLPASVGKTPRTGLIYLNNALFGTAESGGAGSGSVFSVDPATGNGSPLYRFGAPPDAGSPDGELLAVQNELYGVAQSGGTDTYNGAIYKIDPSSGTETLVHSFAAGTDGDAPSGALIYAKNGIYGTTQMGGSANDGTIFRVNPATGKTHVIYSFQGGNDGQYPCAGLLAQAGIFYGTTLSGGPADAGTVFKINPVTRSETVIYSFQGGSDGANPASSLIAVHGSLYGTTTGGGTSGFGTLFSIDLQSGAETILHNFTGGQDGAIPNAGLIYAGGELYGTTESGGAVGLGTVYKIKP